MWGFSYDLFSIGCVDNSVFTRFYFGIVDCILLNMAEMNFITNNIL